MWGTKMPGHATKRILIADSDPARRSRFKEYAEAQHEVLEAETSDEAVMVAQFERPDMVVLGPDLGGKGELAASKEIRALAECRNTPILFLAHALASADRAAALLAGAVDFIRLPLTRIETLSRMDAHLGTGEAATPATAAPGQGASGGAQSEANAEIFLDCIVEGLRSRDPAELARRVIAACEAYGVGSCLQIRTAAGPQSFNAFGVSSAEEAAVMTNLSLCGDMASLGRRDAFNVGRITLMTTDMPVDDPARLAAMRQQLGRFAVGVDACAERIEAALAPQSAHPGSVAPELQRTLVAARGSIHEILTQLTHRMNEQFLSMGLTDNQEEAAAALLDGAIQRVLAVVDQALPSR